MAAPTVSSSFQKKSRMNVTQAIAGTKPSISNNQLLVSTGLPSLDNLMGGGLAVGTVLLVEEDVYATYSSLMLKFFLAEGCVHKHHLYIASNDTSPQDILHDLPQPVCYDVPQESKPSTLKDGEKNPEDTKRSEDALQIAWRYQNLKIDNSVKSIGSHLGHYFDLTKTISTETLAGILSSLFTADVSFSPSEMKQDQVLCPSYRSLLQDINRRITEGQFSTSAQVDQRNILLLGIHGLGSPQWSQSRPSDLLKFLYSLRSILRSSYAACVITMPTHLCQPTAAHHVARIRNLCDVVVRLESFSDTSLAEHAVYKEYHGLFHVVKTPRLNSLAHQHIDTSDLVFKLRRKRFTIEKLHLPPALQENVESETSKKSSELRIASLEQSTGGCGSGFGTNKLDF